MAVTHRTSPKETSRLLAEADYDHSYHAPPDSNDAGPGPAALDNSDADSETSEVTPLNDPSRADLFWILTGLWSAVFLGALDGTIVATLLSPIGSYFNKSNQASYLGTSYLLSVCCFTPLYGRLADILGRKGAMLLGLTLFGSGTIGCGLASSMEMLILTRAIAGMGGGGVMTVSSVAITDLIPLKQRGLYQGMTNILFGLGAGLGGPVGGWVNDTLGWRAAFLLQIPLLFISFTIVALKVNIKLSDEIQNQPLWTKLRRIDGLGAFTLVLAVGTLLLGFSLKTTEELSWSHPLVWGLFTASVVFWGAFVYVEARVAPFPVMPLRLITRRTPLAVSLANFLGSVTSFSMLYNIPLYFSAVKLNSSANAGLHLLPHSIALSTGSVFAGWLMRRTGKLYTLTLCSALLTVLASALVACWNDKTSQFHLWFDVVPQGLGMASLITSTLIAMIAGVYKEDMPVATGITYLFRTTGQVLGVSLSGAILQSVLLRKLKQRITGPNSAQASSINFHLARHSIGSIPDMAPSVRRAAVESYADALHVVFICQFAINILVFICCLPIQEHPLPGTHQEQEEHYRSQRIAQEGDQANVDEP
ncbi:vacuolar amino acid permease [Coniophora puteana RWD-64-598 SS2]|uniref:Vacuolar amino acid permease n=1 Tax=Coniophora puteana (strain RWD-64-598) TaxID=741705 RepID=A0A5M3MTZ6_CONPW|nr:vacuolar amino acid permease [Coniophora puteana RWD-64-598 SS2]EIW82224.1 vacuolar amino acid permease [Coniophora puteana RWD-64-598 SS2]